MFHTRETSMNLHVTLGRNLHPGNRHGRFLRRNERLYVIRWRTKRGVLASKARVLRFWRSYSGGAGYKYQP